MCCSLALNGNFYNATHIIQLTHVTRLAQLLILTDNICACGF